MFIKNKINRAGWHLMSLSSIGQLIALFVSIKTVAELVNIRANELPLMGMSELGLLVTVAVLAFIAQCVVFSRLRRIGKLLYNGVRVSDEMARLWQRLGRILMIAAITTALAPNIQRGGNQVDIGTNFSWSGFFFFMVAWLLTIGVAGMLADAAGIKRENEGFI